MKNSSCDSQYSRHIRVFISSTFIGMEEEREYLMGKVFPEIINKARLHNIVVTPVDLRWGITQQASENGETVKICLKEIENSQPYFIGILGDRYGWQPSIDDISIDPQTTEDFPWLKNDVANRLSMTEIEIQYATLRNKNLVNAYFYISDARSKDENQKRLIREIEENRRYPVCYYNEIKDLGDKIKRDFYQLLEERFPISNDDSSADCLIQGQVINQLLVDYVSRNNIEETLNKIIANNQQVAITGASGIGKSSLLANYIRCSERNNIISYFSISGIESSSSNIKKYLINETETFLDIPHQEYDNVDIRLVELWEDISNSNNEIVYVIDGVSDDISWLPVAPKNITLVVSADKESILELLESRNYYIYEVPLTTIEDRLQITKQYLSRFRKDMSHSQMMNIILDDKSNDLNLLKIVLNELIFNCEYSSYSKHIVDYNNCTARGDYYHLIVDYMMHKFNFAKDVFTYILNSKEGLIEEYILKLVGLSQQQWSQFFCCYSYMFNMYNGRLSCSNRKIKTIIEYECIKDKDFILYKNDIITLFENELKNVSKDEHIASKDDIEAILKVSLNIFPSQDDISRYVRKMCFSQHLFKGKEWLYGELAYQYYSCNYCEKLYQLLLDPIFTICFERNYRTTLIAYWQYLQKQSREKYSFKKTINLSIDRYTDAFISDYYYSLALLSVDLGVSTNYILECINKSIEYLNDTHHAYKQLAIIPRLNLKSSVIGDDSELIDYINSLEYGIADSNSYCSETKYAITLNKAMDVLEHGDYNTSLSIVDSVLEKLNNEVNRTDKLEEYRAVCYRIIADANADKGEREQNNSYLIVSNTSYLNSIELYESLYQKNPLKFEKGLCSVWANYATFLRSIKAYDRAISIYKSLLSLYKDSRNEEGYAILLSNYGGLLTDIAYDEKDEKLYKEAYDVLDSACDIYHHLNQTKENDIYCELFADALFKKVRVIKCLDDDGDRMYEVEMIYKKVAKLYKESNSMSKLAKCFSSYGLYIEERNDYTRAIEFYKYSLDLYNIVCGDNRSVKIEIINHICQCYLKIHDTTNYRVYLLQNQAIYKELYSETGDVEFQTKLIEIEQILNS